MYQFKKIPFFKLVIPLVIGIVLGTEITNLTTNYGLIVALFTSVVILFFIQFQKAEQYKLYYLILADLLLIALGFFSVSFQKYNLKPNHYSSEVSVDSSYTVIAKLSDVLTEKNKTYKCPIVIEKIKINNEYKLVNENSFCYIKKTAITLPEIGKYFIFKAKPSLIAKPLNPNEFDYHKYLERRNIYIQFFVDSGCLRKIEIESGFNLIDYSLRVKQGIIDLFKAELKPEHAAICVALITGYDDEINRTTIKEFANTGTLHVLSVSGLHTGLLYLLINFIFSIIDKNNRFKIIRLIISIVLLWAFALLTGFSAPVLRAVIMFNVVSIGRLFLRYTTQNQLNILCFSGFILLLANPFLFYDVGFQLSYWAMFGLIYLQPKLQNVYLPDNYFGKTIFQNIYSSLAATISTLPVSLYFFHQFPIWFLFCNILIIPLTFLILMLCILFLIKFKFVGLLLGLLLDFLLWFIHLFNSNSTIDVIDFRLPDLIFLSVILVLVNEVLNFRRYSMVVLCAFVLICWQLVNLFEVHYSKSKCLFAVYHLPNYSTSMVKNTTKVIYNQVDSLNFDFHVKPHLITFNNSKILTQPYNYIATKDQAFLILSNNYKLPIANYKSINKLVLQNNYKLTEHHFQLFTKLNEVILDGSIKYGNAMRIEKLCRKFDVNLYSTKTHGAFIAEF